MLWIKVNVGTMIFIHRKFLGLLSTKGKISATWLSCNLLQLQHLQIMRLVMGEIISKWHGSQAPNLYFLFIQLCHATARNLCLVISNPLRSFPFRQLLSREGWRTKHLLLHIFLLLNNFSLQWDLLAFSEQCQEPGQANGHGERRVPLPVGAAGLCPRDGRLRCCLHFPASIQLEIVSPFKWQQP